MMSFACRVMLAKSVIESIHMYPIMTNLLPKFCLEEIQKMQHNFVWGDTFDKKKYTSCC